MVNTNALYIVLIKSLLFSVLLYLSHHIWNSVRFDIVLRMNSNKLLFLDHYIESM